MRRGPALLRLLDYFFLARPVLVAVVWIFPLVGARGLVGQSWELGLLLAQCAGLAGSAFVLNQLHDLEGDRVNRKCQTLAHGLVSVRGARIWVLLLLTGGLAASWALGFWHLLAAGVFFLLAAVGYNLPPLRAKDHPGRAILLAAPAYLLLVLQGASLRGGFAVLAALPAAVPVVLAGLSLSLLATVPDVEGDSQAGKRTWAVAYGGDSAWRVALGLMGAAALLAVAGRDFQVGVPAALSTLLFLWGRRPGDRPRAVAVLRWSVAAQALGLAFAWPWLCLALLLFGWLARFYYKRRFQLSYPSLGWERT